MAVNYTAGVEVTGEGRNGGTARPYSKATRGNIPVTINAIAL
jgi:hypothetical protein